MQLHRAVSEVSILTCFARPFRRRIRRFPVLDSSRDALPVVWAPLGAAIEVGAVLSSIGLIFLVRGHRTSIAFTAAGAACMLVAHVIWWIWVNPANGALAHMAPYAPARDWMEWRNQWEYTHLARFVLQFLGFAMLLVSVLVETPSQRSGRSRLRSGASNRASRTSEPSHIHDTAGVIAPPPLLYFGALMLALLVNTFTPMSFASCCQLLRWLTAAALIALGLMLSTAVVWTFRKSRTPVSPRRPTTGIVRAGLYRYSRNPDYLGQLMIYLGVAVATGTWWSFLLLPLLLVAIQRVVVRREERYLEAKFGYQCQLFEFMRLGCYELKRHSFNWSVPRLVESGYLDVHSPGHCLMYSIADAGASLLASTSAGTRLAQKTWSTREKRC